MTMKLCAHCWRDVPCNEHPRPREHVSGLYWLTWEESSRWSTSPDLQQQAIEEADGRPIVSSHGLRLHPPADAT